MASVAKRTWTYKGEQKTAYVVRYKEGGKHRSRQYDRFKDADAFRKQVEREITDGVHVPKGDALSIAVVCEQFMRHQEQRYRDGRIGSGALQGFKTAIDTDIIPRLGHRSISELTSTDVLDLYTYLTIRPQQAHYALAGGRAVKIRQRIGLNARTARKRIFILKQVFDFARSRGYAKQEIMTTVASELRGIRKVKIRTFELEELRQLFATIEVRSVRGRQRAYQFTRCAVYLAAICGMRIGEIWGLTIDRLRLDDQIIEIRHSLTTKDEHKGPKTAAGNRDVEVPKFLCDLLREWLAHHYAPNKRRLVFRMEDGSQMRPGTFHTSYWRPLLKRAGLFDEHGNDQLHFHALRHFAASWMIHNNVPLTDVASRLGHQTFDMTLGTYAHTISGGVRRLEEVEAMTSRLKLIPAGFTQELRTGLQPLDIVGAE